MWLCLFILSADQIDAHLHEQVHLLSKPLTLTLFVVNGFR